MGLLSTPNDKAAFLKDQAAKAKRDAAKANIADNGAERDRLNEIAKKAEAAAVYAQQQSDEASG